MGHPAQVQTIIHYFIWRAQLCVTLHETSFSPTISLFGWCTRYVSLLEALPQDSLPLVHPQCSLIARHPAPNHRTVLWTLHLFIDHFINASSHPHYWLCIPFVPLCGGALANRPNFTIMHQYTPLTCRPTSSFKPAHLPVGMPPVGSPAH